jgi:hypothetical protein
VAGWEQVIDQPAGPWRVETGSDLAGDDTASHPYQVSGAARTAISAAVSHAGCLRDALCVWTGTDRVTARLHTYGQLALVRGALENASRAAWLLAPDDRATRPGLVPRARPYARIGRRAEKSSTSVTP